MGSRRWLLPALVTLAALFTAAPAGAVNFDVTTTADVGDPTPDGSCGGCSLREAVSEANFLSSDDTVNLRAADYTLVAGELDVGAGAGRLTVVGASARLTAIDGGDVDRVFRVPMNASLDLLSLTVRNGKVTNDSGGGVNSAGAVSLTDVAVTGNEAQDAAGIASTGTLTVTRSTVSGNIASGSGGGIEATALPAFSLPGAVTLVNSTVSSNRASGPGAGISGGGGTVTLQSSTIAANDGGSGDGRGLDLDGATATVTNSVIAGNIDGDCRAVSGGSISSQGGNVASDPVCGFGRAVDARLAALADNGGPTNTHALLPRSPAIDAGTGTGCPTTDQRGGPRPKGLACDAGAFESQPASLTGPATDTVAPRITALAASNPVFQVNRRGRAAARPRVPRGTRFRYRLSEAAGVTFAIQRRTRGRQVGRRCQRETPRNRAQRRCVRWVTVRRFVRAGVAGANSVPFSGRIRRGRKVRALLPGRYRASVRATDAGGNRSRSARIGFRVVGRAAEPRP